MEMTQTIAQISLVELSPILGIFAGMLAGFYAIAKFLMLQAEKDREADRTERQQLSCAISDMAESNRTIADEMRDGNTKAEVRNGHLGEQNVQITKLVLDAKDETINAIQEISEQRVIHQVVENEQVIKRS